MITWIVIIGLIILGLILIVIEVIFVPGTTIVGILGFLAAVVGIYLSFSNFGPTTGSIVLVASLVMAALTLIICFRSGAWTRFALHNQIDSKVNEHINLDLSVGQKGIALSSLKPVGKAEFNDKEYEVKTHGNYVDAGDKIVIIKIENRNIIVEPFKTDS